MIKATFFVSSFYLNNRIFDISDEICNRDDCLYGFHLLKEKLQEKDIDLSTQDINTPSASQIILYNEMPKDISILQNKKNYLLIFESEVIKPDNWTISYHQYFNKIFTWHDQFIDNEKYIKINFPNKLPEKLNFDLSDKNKLCTMIAGHKSNSHPLELYSERVKAIRWFEQNYPADFDLYGMGWDTYCFKDPFSSLNCFKVLTKLLKPKYSSYKGIIKSKREVLKRYKFAICYENVREIPGYITEKIFDCFFAGCVPIYWGAPNITEHVPANTFIDKRKFETFEELYSYLKNMPDNEYLNYLDAIKGFIEGNMIYPFSAEGFAETLSNEIVGDMMHE
ncbi:MAG: alpha(1,3/1,4) fucosyltransferase [Euryarchaeota archaeon]|nr:alpha(1,3/1,4) fucosyltransferase [Euryarchaeota archaeon]